MKHPVGKSGQWEAMAKVLHCSVVLVEDLQEAQVGIPTEFFNKDNKLASFRCTYLCHVGFSYAMWHIPLV